MPDPQALSVSPEQVAQARQMYLDGATVADIRRATGMTDYVKTMRELVALDDSRDGGASPADSEHDDGGSRDLDEFRRELARRMEAIIAARTEAGAGEA
jgi:hypothetical protein